MTIDEFSLKVNKAVEEKLGPNYHVELKEVRKNNGVLLHGLMILSESNNVAPTIYLEHFWRAYEEGMTFTEVLRRLLEIYGKDAPTKSINMDFFKEFEKVRDRICFRLVAQAGNEELLKDIPYVEFLDMAICFFYAYKGDDLGEGSILIHNSHIKMWNCSVANLMEHAKKNTPVLFPWQCCTMEEVLCEMMEKDSVDQLQAYDVPMKILSNRQRTNGAVCLIYQGVLEHLADVYESDLYILPSSIHEVILLSDTGKEKPAELKAMIVQVNRTQVAPEEVLSDSLYRYDRKEKRVELVL